MTTRVTGAYEPTEKLIRCRGCGTRLDAPTVCPICCGVSCGRCLRQGGCRHCLGEGKLRLTDAVAVLVLGLVLLTGAACHRENNPTAPTAHEIALPPEGRVGTAR